jgi:hypothetical protein
MLATWCVVRNYTRIMNKSTLAVESFKTSNVDAAEEEKDNNRKPFSRTAAFVKFTPGVRTRRRSRDW